MQKISVKLIESLKGTGTAQYLSDPAVPNLRMVVSKTGIKSWTWKGRCRGKMLTLTLGRFPSHSLADARAWAADLNDRRDGGEDLTALKASNDPEPEADVEVVEVIDPDAYRTCDWLWELYMKEDGEQYTNAAQKKSWYERYVKPVLGSKHVADPDIDYHTEFMKILRTVRDESGPVASNKVQNMVKRWWKWASQHRDITLLKSNPVTDLPKLCDEEPRDVALNDYEIGVFFRAMNEVKTPLNEGLILILYTAARRNESIQLEWPELNLNKGDWLLPKARNKSGRPHLLCLPSEMVEMLKERQKVSGNAQWVWEAHRSNEDDPKKIVTFSKPMKKINDACQRIAKKDGKRMQRFTIHDLRRTVSTGMNGLLDENDQPKIAPHIVEKVMNHKLGKVAGTYNVHEYYAEKKAALRLWADHLDAIRTSALAATE